MDKMKPQTNVWFVAVWFGSTVTTLIFCLSLILYLSIDKTIKPITQNFKLYAALPQTGMGASYNITHTDGRAKIIENFFKGYKTPLAQYSETFVTVADKYQLDYKLLPSIAMQESHGGQKVINDSHNPFGYGVYGNLVVKFPSWEEAIERVGRLLREDYINKGLATPEQIMRKYTPPSFEKGGSWAKGVSSFMEELR